MEWGSSYVWMYEHSDEEYVSDSELQEGMWLRYAHHDVRVINYCMYKLCTDVLLHVQGGLPFVWCQIIMGSD